MANKIQFGIDFKLDKQGLTQAKSEIEKIKKSLQEGTKLKIGGDSIEKLKREIEAFDTALDRAFDKDLNKLNVNKLNSELKKANISMSDFSRSLAQAGISGSDAFIGLQREILKTGAEVKKTKGLVQDMADTLVNTVKWNIASSTVNKLSGSIQRAVGYIEGMDESLNNIRVVTGKSAKEMELFREEANEAAKALGKTTKEYSDASLIFFQQGKSANEVKELTEATLLGANITGENVSDMADYLTAVMNGYVMEANKALEVTDKLAAVGAATGSDFQELAVGMSKVASMAKVVGVDIDQLNGMLATVTTVTREAPETIGTTFKTIFARMSELQAGGEDEEGWTTGKVEKALNQIGVSVLDDTGALRDMGDVIDQVGGMWENLNKESRVGVTNALAGQRQASRLMALFENWSMYTDAVNTSQNALGSTLEQNAIRVDSIEYKSKQLRAEIEDLWDSLLDEDVFKSAIDAMSSIVSGIDTVAESFGGLENILLTLGGVATKVFSKQIATGLVDISKKIEGVYGSAKEAITKQPELTSVERAAKQSVAEDPGLNSTQREIRNKLIDDGIKLRKQEELVAKNLSAEELKSFQLVKDELMVEQKKLATLQEQRDLKNKSAKKTVQDIDRNITVDQLEDAKELQKLTEQAIKDEEEKNELVKEQQSNLDAIKRLRANEKTSAKEVLDIFTKEDDEITTIQTKQRYLLELYNLQEDAFHDSVVLAEELARIEDEIAYTLEDQNDELYNATLKRKKLAEIAETSKESQQEKDTDKEIKELELKTAEYENQAKNVAKVQAAMEGLGAAMQIVSTIRVFGQLNDDSLTAEERTNIITTGLGQISAAALSLVPVLTSLATAFGATWATALLPVAAIVAGLTAVGAVVYKVADTLDPVNQMTRKNEKALNNYKEALSEVIDEQNRLNDSMAKFSQRENLEQNGLDPSELEEYKTLTDEIASSSPAMVAYYDAFGNAVLKSREEVDKLNESLIEKKELLHETMESQSGSFGAEIAYLQTEGKKREAALNAQLDRQQANLDDALVSGNAKKIQKAREELAETSNQLTKLSEEFDSIGEKAQETLVNPFIQGNKVFKEMGQGLQGFVGNIFNSNEIQKGLDDIAKDGTLTIKQLQEKSEEYLNSFKNGVLKLGGALSALNNSGDQFSQDLVQNLSGLPQDVQKALSSQLLTLSVGLNEEELLGEIKNISNYISDGNLDTFGVIEHFRDVAGPQIAETLSDNIKQGISDGLNSQEIQNALNEKSWFWGETLGKNIAEALSTAATSQTYVGEDATGASMYEYNYSEKLRAQLLELSSAFEQGGQVLVEALANSSSELLQALQTEMSTMDGSFAGTSQYKEGLESLNLLIENTRLQKEEQDALNESLQETGAIFNNFTESMADSIDGQQEIAELWNQMVENTQEVGEGGLFSINLDEMDELNEYLRENAEAMYAYEGATAAAMDANEEFQDSNTQLIDAAKRVGEAFENMADNMGEDAFEKIAKLTGRTADQIKDLAKAASEGSIEAAKTLQNEMGRVYATLNKDSATYFNNFKKVNEDKIRVVAEATGIEADNYATLAEYENALEIWKRDKLGEHVTKKTNTIKEALMLQVENADKAGMTEAEINARTTDAAARAGEIAALLVARNAVQIAEQGGEAGREAGAQMIEAISGVDKQMGWTLSNLANALRGEGDDFQSLLNWIDGKIAEISAKGNFKFDVGAIQMPTFKGFSYSAPSGGISVPSYSGSSGSLGDYGTQGPSVSSGGGGDKGSGGKGSGGSGSKGSEEKEVEDLEWEADIYHDINVELEQKSILLDKLKQQEDKLYGKALLDNLAKQKKALEEQQKLLETKLKMQQQDLANQKAVLSQQGVAFNVDGTIANYNQLLEQKVAYVNSLSGEAKEAAKEEFEKLTEMMEAYEDMILNSIIETENAIQDSIDAQREIFLTEFTYAIDLKIEISDDFKEALDFVKEMNDEYEEMSDNYERTIAQMGEQVDLVERLKIKLDEINNNPNLSEKERLELLEKYNDELKDAIKDLNKLNDELTTIFEKTLKDGLDINKKHLENFKSLNSELKHYEQTLKLIGEGDNFQVLDSIYEAQYNNLMSQINVLNKQMDVLQTQRDALKAEGMEGTKEWEAIDKAIKDTQKDINSLAQESLKLLQTEFKNSVNEMLSTLEDAMTGGAGFKELKKQQQEIKDERKKYLDGEEKLLAVSKLQQKVQKEIDETSDPAKKKQLQKFMDSELKNLKEKDKLTKYDVDRANQVYDLTLKQMALEDQRATKNIMRLVRDTQGNWVYEFTEDANAIQKAQEEVSSSMEKLMELDKKKLEETQDLMLKLQEEYYKEVQQIANDAANGKYKTEEELRQALQVVNDKYNQKMIEANAEYEYVKQNATLSSMAVIVDSYAKTGDILENLTTEQEIILQALADKTSNSYLEMTDIVSNLISGDDDSIKSAMIELGLATEAEMDSVSNTISSTLENLGTNTTITLEEVKTAVGGLVANMQNDWGISISDMISQMISTGGFKDASTQAIQGVQNKWTEYQGKVQEVQKATGTDLNTMKTNIENVDKATEELNKETVALTNKFKEEMTAVTNLTNAYKGYRAEIQNTIKELTNYVAEINRVIDALKRKNDTEAQANKKPSTSGGTSSGGSSGSSSSGSSSGAASPPAIKVGSRVTLKPGTRWYYDSYGASPMGTVDSYHAKNSLQITTTNSDSKAGYPINVGPGPGQYVGWIRKSDIVGYDTGGYTGEWGKEGKMAFLHEKEIVLNKEDTSKILDAVKLVRGISGDALSGLAGMIAETSRRTIEALGAITQAVMPSKIQTQDQGQQIQQNVEINADFSGVKSSNEIEKAFENMANMASQYIARK